MTSYLVSRDIHNPRRTGPLDRLRRNDSAFRHIRLRLRRRLHGNRVHLHCIRGRFQTHCRLQVILFSNSASRLDRRFTYHNPIPLHISLRYNYNKSVCADDANMENQAYPSVQYPYGGC